MNHIGDTNKMVSDTPRVDSDNRLYPRPEYAQEIEFEEGSRHVVISPEAYEELYGIARTLERELNAANELIVRLQAVTNDPHALWANWLRGSVALPVGIGDVRKYEDRIKRLEEAGDAILNANNDDEQYEAMKQWRKAKEAKL